MNTRTNYHNRSTTLEEQKLYDHLLQCVANETTDDLIARFRALFIDGVGYPDRDVALGLDEILATPDADQYFRYILNRCCHILINRWQTQPQLQPAIPNLIGLFEQEPVARVTEYSRSRSVRRLRQIVREFQETEQYTTLRRLALVIESRQRHVLRDEDPGSTPLGTLINRYPYLYEYCLVSDDSDLEHQHHVRRIQVEAQHKFEVDLSHYVNYRVRLARLNRQHAEQSIERLRQVDNPTLLSDRDLVSSLKQFSGKVGDGRSYRDGANRFLLNSCQTSPSYRVFKEELYDYILTDVDPGYSRRQFGKVLNDQLIKIYSDSDSKPVNDFLIVRTCSQLLNFLVVDSAAGGKHFVFIDLINNLGPILTTGLLLKIVLICRKVKPYLERRFSILFNHYETSTRDMVMWLVNMLENLNIALSLNFGTLDLSHIIGS